LPGGLLEKDQAVKLFDMKKFQQNINREMKRQRPERNKLESQVSVSATVPLIEKISIKM
jgi:hypothetical protein